MDGLGQDHLDVNEHIDRSWPILSICLNNEVMILYLIHKCAKERKKKRFMISPTYISSTFDQNLNFYDHACPVRGLCCVHWYNSDPCITVRQTCVLYSVHSSGLSCNKQAVPAVFIATGWVCVSHYLSRNLIMEMMNTSLAELDFSGMLTRF